MAYWDEGTDVNLTALLNEVCISVENNGDEIVFTTVNGKVYKLLHYQSCCESVYVEDVCGDLEDLVGVPILQADESTSDEDPPGFDGGDYRESYTWTFYKFATIKGSVTIRFYGTSNGYYSESVSFVEV